MEVDIQLSDLLVQKRELDLKIEKYLLEKSVRFSSKKFVGDLGEYYFLIYADFLTEVNQELQSNSDYDLKGTIKDEYLDKFGIENRHVRIEVKTRHAQTGDNHLKGINPKKFDLLAFIALDEQFACRHIGVIKSIDIEPRVDRQKRIRYTEFWNNKKVVWHKWDWKLLK